MVCSAVALLVAGCAIDQDKETAQYKRELNVYATPAPTYNALKPLTLIDAMALANAHNERLARGGEDYLQAIIDKNRAVANFLPTLTFQPAYTIQDAPRGRLAGTSNTGGTGTGVTPGAGGGGTTGTVTGTGSYRKLTGGTQHRFEAPLVGSINLFRAGADVANLKVAQSNIEAQRQLLLDLQAATMLSVAESYYAVLRAERSAAVLTNTLQLQQARLRDVEQQFNNGLATRLAVAQTRAQLENTRVLLVQAQSDVVNGRSTLALIVGVDSVGGPLRDDFRAPLALPTLAEWQESGLRVRPDLAALLAQQQSFRDAVQVAVARYYPSVSLNVSGFLYREFYDDASRWNGILSANLPIFSAGLIRADVRTAWSLLRQASLDLSYGQRQARTEIAQAFENFTAAGKRIDALRDEVAAADEAYQQSRAAFQNGLGLNLDVLTSQDQLLSAQLDLSAAEFDQAVFYLDLRRAAGSLSNIQLAEETGQYPATQPATQPAR